MKLDPQQGIIAIGRLRASLQRVALGGGPSLGALCFHRVREYRGRVPGEWAPDALFAPVAEGEAVWLGFAESRPPAVRVQVGFAGLNAANGEPWGRSPDESAGNFLLCPGRAWLDGVYRGEGEPVLQFAPGAKEYETLRIELDCPRQAVTIYCASPGLYRRVTGRDPPAPPGEGDVYDGSPLP
ncbi:MAG: hypothetical protein ABSC23_07125 [Bryobacteraceae bacterium]